MILIEVKPIYEILSMSAQGIAALGTIWIIWKQIKNAREDSLRQQSEIHQLAQLADQSIIQSKRMTEVALHLAKLVELYSRYSVSDLELKKQKEESDKHWKNLEIRPIIDIKNGTSDSRTKAAMIVNNGGRADIYEIKTSPNIIHKPVAPFSIQNDGKYVSIFLMATNSHTPNINEEDMFYTIFYTDLIGNKYTQTYQQKDGRRIVTEPVSISE